MRRKPTALKALSGTLRKNRVNRREPRPPGGLPAARHGTTLAVRREHARLQRLLALMPGVATQADAAALELAASAFAEYRAAAAVVLQRGATYNCTTASGAVMHRARPEVGIAADAWRRAHQALQTFGLSPASRPKVEGAVVLTRDPVEEFRKQRRPRPAAAPSLEIDEFLRRRAERVAVRRGG